jgi:hypothetical protein
MFEGGRFEDKFFFHSLDCTALHAARQACIIRRLPLKEDEEEFNHNKPKVCAHKDYRHSFPLAPDGVFTKWTYPSICPIGV